MRGRGAAALAVGFLARRLEKAAPSIMNQSVYSYDCVVFLCFFCPWEVVCRRRGRGLDTGAALKERGGEGMVASFKRGH